MSKHLKTLPEDIVLKAIEDEEDILTSELEKVRGRISKVVCPQCGNSAVPRVSEERPFLPNAVLPTYIPFCPLCNEPIIQDD